MCHKYNLASEGIDASSSRRLFQYSSITLLRGVVAFSYHDDIEDILFGFTVHVVQDNILHIYQRSICSRNSAYTFYFAK